MRTGNRKKLSLNRETVLDLDPASLGGVGGGKSRRCDSGICSASGVCVCEPDGPGNTLGTLDPVP